MTTALQQNLNNLHHFWAAMPNEQSKGIQSHSQWPNKVWASDFSLFTHKSSNSQALVTTEQTDINDALSSAFKVKFSLTMMNLTLDESQGKPAAQVTTISTTGQLNTWTRACSEAFGYDIDASALTPLLTNPDASILAYLINDDIAATAITYKTGGVMGIHQMGVTPNFRGKGLARDLMLHILATAKEQNCSFATLQASKAGMPLYTQLGFKPLAPIYHLTSQ